MFTGIVEEVGTVRDWWRSSDRIKLTISARKVLQGTKLGDSIAVDGVCQTVTVLDHRSFQVDVLRGSLEKTTLGELKPGQRVNLERALALGERMGGHLVQGHVNCRVPVQKIKKDRENIFLTVDIPGKELRYCIPEGSIALQGVSLTIYEIQRQQVTVNIIPHTWENTVLRELEVGSWVNFEADLIARHLEALMQAPHPNGSGMDKQKMSAWGYL